MIRISEVRIQRYRSIMDLKIDFDLSFNLVSICGKNNVGKTNLLRAINLFFNPDSYEPSKDIPEFKNATWGGAVHPRVTITFLDDKENYSYTITRDLKPIEDAVSEGLSGSKKKFRKKIKKEDLSISEIKTFLRKIQFIYIESINQIVPEVISDISEEMIDIKYDKSRFSQNKSDLRAAYVDYVNGLQKILNEFAKDISSVFNEFRPNWNVKFEVPNNADKFRNLISDDVSLVIDDAGSIGIEDKGSGLQRLALLLLQFEVLDRLKAKKSPIILIDEPDLFLHEGLQRKFKEFLENKSKSIQIIYTTHSKVFINTYRMKNVFLLDAEITKQYVKRKDKDVNLIKTYCVDFRKDEGYKLIIDHLGIEEASYEILSKVNLIVEGGCDKKYLSEFIKYFDLEEINIIPANGANNISKHLEFYDSFYKENGDYRPMIRVILDNDNKGREVFLRLNKKEFNNIVVEFLFLPNFLGESPNISKLDNCRTNNEIEDFLYPELFCYLVNKLLQKKNLVEVECKKICDYIQQPSFKDGGILSLTDHEKNEANPEYGNQIAFVGSDKSTTAVKDGLAGIFVVEGNKEVIEIIERNEEKYPNVRLFLKQITKIPQIKSKAES